MKKIKRYHKDIFFPSWWSEGVEEFSNDVSKPGIISFSIHSLEKIVDYTAEYGKLLFKYLTASLRKSKLVADNVFEFYANEEQITKCCFRFSFEKFPVSIVLVISRDGRVVTVYTINKGDNHRSLDKNLYERS